MERFETKSTNFKISSHWAEGCTALGLIVLGALIQFTFLHDKFTGPDWRTFQRLSEEMNARGYWSSPSSFDGGYWPIGYHTLIHFLTQKLNFSIHSVQVLQLLLVLLLACSTWILTHSFGPVVRLTALGVACLDPTMIWMAENAGYEVCLAFFLVLPVLILWGRNGLSVGPKFWRSGAAGALAGLSFFAAIAVQGKVIVLLPFLLFLAYKWGRQTLFALVAGFATPLGILYFWYVTIHNFILPISANGPVNFWMANNPMATFGGYMDPPRIHSSDTFFGAGIKFVLNQPEFAIQLLLRRIERLFEPNYIYPAPLIDHRLGLPLHVATFTVSSILLLLFLVYAFGRLWVSPPVLPKVGFFALFYAGFLAIHLPFLSEARFRAPVEPLLIAVAIPTIFALKRRFQTDHDPGAIEESLLQNQVN